MTHRTLLLSLAAAAIGWALAANAEVRRTAPAPQAFRSGAQRSEEVLREIAATLRSIDARLARVEATVGRLANSPGGRRAP